MNTLTKDQTVELLSRLQQYKLIIFEIQNSIEFKRNGRKLEGYIDGTFKVNHIFGLPVDFQYQIKNSTLDKIGKLTIEFNEVLEFKIRQERWRLKRFTICMSKTVVPSSNEIMNLIN